MEMTTARFNEITNKIEECVKEYDKMHFNENKQTLFLANGDIINIKVTRNNVPHLLGVNLDYLSKSNLFRSDVEAYSKLKFFLENAYSFTRLAVNQKKLDYDLMFSDYIDEKLESFINNIKIRTDDMQFVIKYDGEKTYGLEDIHDKCDYYIIRKQDDIYYVLGVIKYENSNIYNPVTNKMYKDEKEFNKFITRIAKKQEITFPTTLKIENLNACYENSFTLKNNGKLKSLKNIIAFSKEYDATAAVANECCYSLNLLNNSKFAGSKILSALKTISENIKNGNIIDVEDIDEFMEEMDIPEELLGLINICNDNVCSNFESANTTYTELYNEKTALKQELQELRQQLATANEQIDTLTTENAELKEQNNNYNEQMNILDEAYQKIKEIKK